MQIYFSLPRNQAKQQKKIIVPNTANLANVMFFIHKYPMRDKTGNPMYTNVYGVALNRTNTKSLAVNLLKVSHFLSHQLILTFEVIGVFFFGCEFLEQVTFE